MKRVVPFAFATLLAGCGGGQTHTETASASPPPEQPAQQDDHGIVIEGQMGFLSEEQLEGVLQPATPQLAGCYNDRLATCSYLSGRVELKFHIGRDGAPMWVIPTSSTIGDRQTEQCMIERAMALHFPPPRGGETETTFPLEFAGGDDARPATDWPSTRVERAVAQHRGALQHCTSGAHGPYVVTLNVAPHGTVANVGVSVANQQAAGAIDCIVREVSSWHLSDPGSWYAKANFTLE